MSRPTWARWVTRISLGLGIIALVLTIRDTGLVAIGTYFKRIGWGWFVVVVLEIAITTMDATAIRAFLSPESDKVRLRSALRGLGAAAAQQRRQDAARRGRPGARPPARHPDGHAVAADLHDAVVPAPNRDGRDADHRLRRVDHRRQLLHLHGVDAGAD